MEEYKMESHIVIISQYLGQQHQFIIKNTENFEEKFREMAEELFDYKISDGNLFFTNKLYELKEAFHLYTGDIYLFTSDSYAKALDAVEASRNYGKISMKRFENSEDAYKEHHNYEKVKEIINKYFETVSFF